MKRKPTRKDLLVVINRLQEVFSKIAMAHSDRNPNRAEDIEKLWNSGFNLCVEALSQDNPIMVLKGPWAE